MFTTITKKQLQDAIQKAFPAVPSKSSLQILSNFKVVSGNGQLTITATDLDQSIIVTSQVGTGDAFELAVSAKKVFDIVRELPDGEVRMGVEDGVFSLQSESGFSCKIAGADAKDFPPVPARQDVPLITLPAKAAARMIGKSSFAVAKDESRACLCGVYLEIDDNSQSMVATDGHRLGKSVISGKTGASRKITAIVSQKALHNLAKCIEASTEKDTISLSVGEKYVWMTAGSTEICSKLIDGPYPDYSRAIPQNNQKRALCPRRILIDAVRRVCVLSNQKTNLVRFAFTAGNLELSVLNRDIAGEAREAIPVEYEGPDHVIGFNGYYLSEILGIISSEKVRMEMNTEISACLLFPHPDQEAPEVQDLFLIMPLRILDEA